MHRSCLLAALLLFACGKSPTPPPDDPGHGEGIQGSLTVHSNLWELVTEPDNIQGLYVLLGDGSRFRTTLSREGVAHFEDPAIVGPQDVTLLAVVKDDPEVMLFPASGLRPALERGRLRDSGHGALCGPGRRGGDRLDRAPASITSFTPFTLPAELTTTTVRASSYMVDARSQYRAGQYMDGFTEAAASGGSTTPTETRSTVVSGYVDLKD